MHAAKKELNVKREKQKVKAHMARRLYGVVLLRRYLFGTFLRSLREKLKLEREARVTKIARRVRAKVTAMAILKQLYLNSQ